MQSNQIFEKFEKIEQQVQELIEIRQRLEKENSDLKEYTSELERELQNKVEAENKYTEERELIRNKVDGLLRRLDLIQADSSNPDI